jgi:hypothetical protein
MSYRGLAAIFTALGLCACSRGSHDGARPSSSAKTRSPAPKEEPATKPPQQRLELPASPYAVSFALDGGRPTLLTEDTAYRLDSGEVRRVPLGRGELGVLGGDSVVKWEGGRLSRFSWAGGAWSTVVRLEQAPQRLVASPDALAWVEAAASSATIWATAGSEPRRLVSAPSGIAALALRDDQLFFVEDLGGGRWRLGAVSLSGGQLRYGEPQSGRTPAMLAVSTDVFYYDGPSSSVYRASTDLKRVDVVGHDVICSPIAAAENIYCAAPPGAIVEVSLSGRPPRVVAAPGGGTVTALTATATEVTWLRESGTGLVVESVPL